MDNIEMNRHGHSLYCTKIIPDLLMVNISSNYSKTDLLRILCSNELHFSCSRSCYLVAETNAVSC